ncbi:hypothetical protein BO82DRAFT_353441 [Aspergillus uvarum CBS 121591]|uniref:Uncharacterized protein n=1 Tax=Aspergillus uvarum CBS 121591 TaxID=1448315 RepID=A0A319CEC3_9EURO|nr:hypothetical protein BO82DRAFT_353441 [Aspergillus uvarum CBS 121591]PYH82830.1 hypothetical protein BO82DRAFT_353441 [Aspergillus uvarum CBS 121591]
MPPVRSSFRSLLLLHFPTQLIISFSNFYLLHLSLLGIVFVSGSLFFILHDTLQWHWSAKGLLRRSDPPSAVCGRI